MKLFTKPYMLMIAICIAGLLHAAPVHAQGFDFGMFEMNNIVNLGEGDPREIIVRLVNVALEFLGIITLVVILWGGFQFLVSGGKDEKVKAATATLRNAIIGLVIIVLSWTIVRFVITEFIAAIDDDAARPQEEVIPNPNPPASL